MNETTDPLYQTIYKQLRKDIQAGKYTANQRLPTEKELCQTYHVSRITAKKALNLLAEEKLIMRIKGKGSYIYQNQKSLTHTSNRKQPIIGVILSTFDNSFGRELLAAIEENCRQQNILCLFFHTTGNQQSEDIALDNCIDLGVDGIVITPVYGTYYSAKILQLVLNDYPIVVLDRALKGIPTHLVCTDNTAAAQQAIDYLVKCGHKKIGIYAHFHKNISSVEDRVDGAKRSLQANNINTDEALFCTRKFNEFPLYQDDERFIQDRNMIMEHLANNPDITAAFALNYKIAVLIKCAAAELGLSIPNDLNIMSFDSPIEDIPGQYFFTHMQQRQDEIGKQAIQLLCTLMRGESTEKPVKIRVPAKLVLGTSTNIPSYL